MDIFIAIIEIIIILGLLISLHEAGHLSMAKAFHVYCFEYSIGFGPALLHKKRKNGETYFSLRAIPLGGYVSMYGETGEMPDGYEAPDPSRSLNAIAKWKKAIVLVAGVFLNFVLGLVLIFISNIAFPQYYASYAYQPVGSSQTIFYSKTTYSEQVLSYIEEEAEEGFEPSSYFVNFLTIPDSGLYVLLSDDVTISGTDESFVALYSPSTLLKPHELSDSILFYRASTEGLTDEMLSQGIEALPDPDLLASGESYLVSSAATGTTASFSLSLIGFAEDDEENVSSSHIEIPFTLTVEGEGNDRHWADSGIEFEEIRQWLGWNGAWQQWAKDVPNACGAIVKGIGSLFTAEGFSNLSGIVGMTAALPNIQASGGWARIFYFAGLLSINLAFFNLLPFPGLDGWALLVTAIEGITRKRVPAKAQSIMSIIGMVLLFGLMIAVTVKDIIQLF